MQLETLLYEVFGEGNLPLQRVQKCKAIYNLARTCEVPGCFVDLGTWHGYSSIAMAVGAQENSLQPRPVFTIDTFTDRQGWAGEPYGEEDRTIFVANRLKADSLLIHEGGEMTNLYLHQADALQWAGRWGSSIALLHWDLGCGNRVEKDIEAWFPHMAVGGGIAIHDTMDHRFGALALLEKMESKSQVWAPRTLPAGIQLAVKRGL
jgi:hypothetical protein